MFRIFQGDRLIREERLAQSVIKVGKVPSAHLRIDDESVSRMHAIVEVTGGEVSIIDLGSTRGTLVNGKKITKAKLHTGDSIQLGDSRVEIAIAAPALAHEAAVAPTLPAATPPAAPVASARPPAIPSLATPPAAPAALRAARAESVDEVGGARAVEVAAMLGDSVVGVKHCMDPRGGKMTPATWGLAAGGLACLLASATAFYASIDNAASNTAARERHVRVLHKPAYSFRPHEVSGAVGGVAFGGLALGLSAVTAALVRSRRERRSPFYRIGTAPGVEQPIEHAPSESFPLVAPSGDDFVFNYGPGIDGELIVDGTSTPLAELAAAGRVRPSATTPGAVELPIPAMSRIRARAGQTTFLISAVARPKRQATTALATVLEGRTAKYVAGSLAAHLALVFVLYQMDVAEAGVSVDLASREPLPVAIKDPAKELQPPKPEEGDSAGAGEGDSQQTKPMALPEGTAGNPKEQRTDGKLAIKNNDVPPQLSREQEIEAARSAGFLGSTRLRDDIASMTSELKFSSGFDTENRWGPLEGAEGAGHGTFGMGVSGDGRGGGCYAPPCGIIGTGKTYTGTIGTGEFAGEGWGGKRGHGQLRGHVAMAPVFSTPIVYNDGIDRSIIKRYIKQREARISYCYEKELLAHPGIAGEVKVQFLISATGNVQSSVGVGFDANVATCVADVIHAIDFPASKSGSTVTVNYPFIFKTAGGSGS